MRTAQGRPRGEGRLEAELASKRYGVPIAEVSGTAMTQINRKLPDARIRIRDTIHQAVR
jgi:hypothetical protein